MTSDNTFLGGQAFAAILFDLDGTLIDSTPAVVTAWVSWAHEFGVDPAALRGMHGIPARGVIDRLLPNGPKAAAEARITEIEVATSAGIQLLPGAARALRTLSGHEPNRLAIATSCTDELFEARLSGTGLVRPDVVVTASHVARGKPSPDPYLAAAQRLSIDPAECLVVEDAAAGLRSGKAAGCVTLAVTTSTSREDLVATGDADAIITSLADVEFTVTPAGVTVTLVR